MVHSMYRTRSSDASDVADQLTTLLLEELVDFPGRSFPYVFLCVRMTRLTATLDVNQKNTHSHLLSYAVMQCEHAVSTAAYEGLPTGPLLAWAAEHKR